MDQQYSVILGRPLGISSIGDCPSPISLTTRPIVLRLWEFVDKYSLLARQILSNDALMSITKIDDFSDMLVGLWDTMPASLNYSQKWIRQDTEIADPPLAIISASEFDTRAGARVVLY